MGRSPRVKRVVREGEGERGVRSNSFSGISSSSFSASCWSCSASANSGREERKGEATNGDHLLELGDVEQFSVLAPEISFGDLVPVVRGVIAQGELDGEHVPVTVGSDGAVVDQGAEEGGLAFGCIEEGRVWWCEEGGRGAGGWGEGSHRAVEKGEERAREGCLDTNERTTTSRVGEAGRMDKSRLKVSGTPALSCYTIQSTTLPSPLLDAISLVLLGTAVASGVRSLFQARGRTEELIVWYGRAIGLGRGWRWERCGGGQRRASCWRVSRLFPLNGSRLGHTWRTGYLTALGWPHR